eukprot:3850350-Amphidinium_carterae.1
MSKVQPDMLGASWNPTCAGSELFLCVMLGVGCPPWQAIQGQFSFARYATVEGYDGWNKCFEQSTA